MNKLILWVIFTLFAGGFFICLYKINEPVADWHSFRQSDTAAVSKIYTREGIDLLYPKYYDISNVQSGFDNPQGYRFVEFPIYNATHALLFKAIPFISFEAWGRLINIIGSLISALVIYLLVKKYSNQKAAVFSLIIFLFLPFSIFYSRTILPDVWMTTSILLGTYFFDKFLEKRKKMGKTVLFYMLAITFTALSFLLKPFALFFTLPIVYLAFKKYGFGMFLKWHLYLFLLITVIPIGFWRYWIIQFPEGIPVSSWLFNGNDIRFRPAFFRWIFYERITKLILGYFGVIFLFANIFLFKSKNYIFFLSFALSSLIYLFVIATGNVQHDYYQTAIIPTISIFTGLGAFKIYELISKRINSALAGIFISLVFILSFYFAWVQVEDYFNINDRGMVEAGRRADEVLPKDAIVIAPYGGSTAFLNIISRPGWPVFQNPIEELIEKGATHLVIANPTENDFSGFGQEYEKIDSSENYLILELK